MRAERLGPACWHSLLAAGLKCSAYVTKPYGLVAYCAKRYIAPHTPDSEYVQERLEFADG